MAHISAHISIVGELTHKIRRAKETLFTGVLAIGTDTEVEWFLYFLVGQIVWANTHTHAKRRWHRQFLKYSSDLHPKTIHTIAHHPQNYKTVAQLVMQQKFSREQFSQIVVGCISEILFDIVHRATLKAKHSQTPLISQASVRNGAIFPCIGLHRKPVWEQVQQEWAAWQQANLTEYEPNLAPQIVQADILKERLSLAEFQNLERAANGQQTIRDLAAKTVRALLPLTQSLVPHIRRDLIKLVEIDDLPLTPYGQQRSPVSMASLSGHSAANRAADGALGKVGQVTRRKTANGTGLGTLPPVAALAGRSAHQPSLAKGRTVIAYVDDTPADSQAMAAIFKASEYRYVNIADSLRALPKLIELKPQLIFLDLVMPVVNGYELCAQIRRISMFADIPIIIMTNNNGIPDRVRAKVVGSTGFLGKPITPKRVLKVVFKHLQTQAAAPSAPAHFHRLLPSV